MVLSDRTIERLIAEGRIAIDPYDVSLLQPSSVDVRVDRYFRVFHNARYPYIDVKLPQEELTEQVEIDGDRPFILHPGEFVLGSTLERVTLPDDLVARLGGEELARPTRPADPLDRGLHRPGLGRPRDARAVERREPADHDLPRDEDRPDLLHAAERADVDAVRHRVARLEVPGPARPDARPATGRTSSREDPRHRGDGLRRAEHRPRASRREPRRPCARPPARARDEPDLARRRGRRRATSPTRRA